MAASRSLASQRKDGTGAAQTLELVLSARLQGQARTVEEVASGAGDEHVSGTGERSHARRRVDADAARLSAHDLHPAGGDAAAHADPETRHRRVHRGRRTHGPRGSVEEREEAVAGRADLAAAEAVNRRADPDVVLVEDR